MLRRWSTLIALFSLGVFVSSPAARAQEPKHLTARAFNSGFDLSYGTFNGMLTASDGKIYYILCAANKDTGAGERKRRNWFGWHLAEMYLRG